MRGSIAPKRLRLLRPHHSTGSHAPGPGGIDLVGGFGGGNGSGNGVRRNDFRDKFRGRGPPRGRERFSSARLGDGNRLQQRSGAQTERWKHDKYEDAKQSPTNEEEQIAKVTPSFFFTRNAGAAKGLSPYDGLIQ